MKKRVLAVVLALFALMAVATPVGAKPGDNVNSTAYWEQWWADSHYGERIRCTKNEYPSSPEMYQVYNKMNLHDWVLIVVKGGPEQAVYSGDILDQQWWLDAPYNPNSGGPYAVSYWIKCELKNGGGYGGGVSG